MAERPEKNEETAKGTAKTSKRRSDLWREYEQCARLEGELVRIRWTFFTALLSVSLVAGSFALSQLDALGSLLGKAGLVFSWLIFVAGYYHYIWFHRRAHGQRHHLCKLEKKLKIRAYRIRTRRPHVGPFPVYFHWAIDVLALAYTIILILVIFNLLPGGAESTA